MYKILIIDTSFALTDYRTLTTRNLLTQKVTKAKIKTEADSVEDEQSPYLDLKSVKNSFFSGKLYVTIVVCSNCFKTSHIFIGLIISLNAT